MNAVADRNLLFGLLAVQTGFIDRDVLYRAFNAWMLNKNRSLGDVLLDQQALTATERQYLDELTDRCVDNHAGDARRSLAHVGSVDIAQALISVGDSDVQASLSIFRSTANGNGLGQPIADGSRFTVLRPHARGGLGQVHVAYDKELNREVALKELLSHVADSAEVQARFLLEANITSRLEHPGIVPMYGLGVGADGRPYYVMRLIRGKTMQRAIADFHSLWNAAAAPSKDLIGEQRRGLLHLLREFITVCQTVAYAHTRGVIHRDLKPANVVIGDYGETFVVDWGLAKVLGQPTEPATAANDLSSQGPSSAPTETADGAFATPMATETGRLLGTPAYMSPEQADGRWDQLGPASDIYSLGAMVYTILTGRPPCMGESNSVLTAVRTGDWLPPRQVNDAAPAALDAICTKALALDPKKRYATATDLAADIERWMADDPVTAWVEPLSVRCGRWVRRHRGMVAAACALLVTTVIGLAVGLVVVDRERRQTDAQRVRTQHALDETAIQRKRTREALDEMTSGVTTDWLATQKELLPQQKLFLEKSLSYYLEFTREQANDETSRVFLAKAQLRVASMLQRLGRNAEAEPSFRAAIANWAQLAADFPAELDYRSRLAQSRQNLGVLLSNQADKSAAEAEYRQALALYESAVGDGPNVPEYRRRLAACHISLGVLLKLLGKLPDAEAAYGQAMGLLEKLTVDYPDVPDYQSELGQVCNNLGNVLSNQKKKVEAEAAYRKALTVQEKLSGQYPAVPNHRHSLAKCHNNLAIVLNEQGKKSEAEAAYRRMVAIYEKLAADFPGVPDYSSDLAAGLCNLGTILPGTGNQTEAEALFRRATTIQEKLAADYPAITDHRSRLADCCIRIGMMLKDRGEPQASLDWFDRAIGLFQPILEQNPKLARERERLNYAREKRAAAVIVLPEQTKPE